MSEAEKVGLTRRYRNWRKTLPGPVFFVLAVAEVCAFLVGWVAGLIAIVAFVSAPVYWGGWGIAVWAAVYVLVLAISMTRDHLQETSRG